MKTPPLSFSLCLLGGLLLGPTALGAQEPRSVLLKPPAARRSASTASAPAKTKTESKRYWADYEANAIKRSDPDGSNVETVASEVEGPYGLGQDPETGHLVWTSSPNEVVQLASPDALDKRVTLTTAFEPPFALMLQGEGQDIAYGVDEGRVLRFTRSRSTGEEKREVLLTLASPDELHGLALLPDEKALYLGDAIGRMTRKLDLATLKVTPLVYTDGEVPGQEAPKAPMKATPPTAPASPAEKTR